MAKLSTSFTVISRMYVPSQYIDVTADYSIEVPAMIHKDNVYGAQFHPEKIRDIGLGIIEQFVGLCKA